MSTTSHIRPSSVPGQDLISDNLSLLALPPPELWKQEPLEPGVTGTRSHWNQESLEPGVTGTRSHRNQESLEPGVTGTMSHWNHESLEP